MATEQTDPIHVLDAELTGVQVEIARQVAPKLVDGVTIVSVVDGVVIENKRETLRSGCLARD